MAGLDWLNGHRCTHYNSPSSKLRFPKRPSISAGALCIDLDSSASVNLMSRLRNVALATGLLAFAAAGLLFPFFLATSRSKPIIDASKPLPPQATFRGPYVNTGSHDIGPDTTTYTKK
ncbi:uncharacterized protein LOC135623334 [Musa acuminata AAA Group]|uniref:uncharacterized protein LOC103974298 n=1 Tax=Musa acuminata AAA Group TaxID=214697 RepID=UPI0031CE5368